MTKITLIKGDITTQKVDAIVNAANRSLHGGGGVDGAIHDAAGDELYEECVALNGCETGEAKITKGYNLPAKYVIHTVGPDYGYERGRESELLDSCYITTLNLAQKNGIRTIAFPAIAVGVYHYPLQEATKIAVSAIKHFIGQAPDAFDEIRFVAFTDEVYLAYETTIPIGPKPVGEILKDYEKVLLTNKTKTESYIYYFKCQPCQLEFVIFSWNSDWSEKNSPFCPECGKQEAHLLRRNTSEKWICGLNCN